MPEEQTQFKIDKTNLLRAGKIPVIAAAIGGAVGAAGWCAYKSGMIKTK